MAGAGDAGGPGGPRRPRVVVAVAALVVLLHLVEGLGQVRPDVELAAAVVVDNAAPPVQPVDVLERVVDVVVAVVDDCKVLGVAVSCYVLGDTRSYSSNC